MSEQLPEPTEQLTDREERIRKIVEMLQAEERLLHSDD